MIDSSVSFISITTRSAESRSRRLRLSFLISREREKLKRLVLVKLEHASIENHDKLVKYQEEVLRIENLIKYLHSHVRFYIENINDNFFLMLKRFSKNQSSSSSTRIFSRCFAKFRSMKQRTKDEKRSRYTKYKQKTHVI
jgi:hypothetical protein